MGDTYKLKTPNGMISWLDDNETKYKWNGALTNLSDMDPKDYATTVFHVIVTGLTGSTLINNKVTIGITVSSNTYYFTAVASSAVTSQLSIALSTDSFTKMITIPSGGISGSVNTEISSSQDMPKIENGIISPTSDSKYLYILDIPVYTDRFKSYHGVILRKNISSLSIEDILAMELRMIGETGETLTFTIPPRDVLNPTEEQLQDCTYCLILCYPKEIYTANKCKIIDMTSVECTDFEYNTTFMIDGKEFVLLCNYSEGTEFVGRYGKTITYEYTAKYMK